MFDCCQDKSQVFLQKKIVLTFDFPELRNLLVHLQSFPFVACVKKQDFRKKIPKNYFKKNIIRPLLKNPEKDSRG